MAKYGEWNMKGGTLSDETAQAEYELEREFIMKGIKAGKLEWRSSSIYGTPIVRILRSQLEAYILEELGSDHLARKKHETELHTLKKELGVLTSRMNVLQLRQAELEVLLGLQSESTAVQNQPRRRSAKNR